MINKISINEHSSIKIQSDKIIYFDPFRIKEETKDADLIFITHSHFDHFSKEDIAKVINNETIIFFPKSMEKEIENEGYKNVEFMEPNETKEVLGIKVEAIPSYNINKPMHPKTNGWLGYVVEVEGQRIYVLGDSDATIESKNVNCDIVLVPIGGTYTMDAIEAASLINFIKPKVAIPTHFGTLVGKQEALQDFIENVEECIEVVSKINFEKV